MRKYLHVSKYCRIFASEKETNNKLNPKTRKGTKIMKFFQVLISNKFDNVLNRQYTQVYNYASLAEALKTMRLYEDKDAVDGIDYTDKISGKKVVQFHLNYEENGAAVIELRHEYYGIPEGCSVEQTVCTEAVYVKEINL